MMSRKRQKTEHAVYEFEGLRLDTLRQQLTVPGHGEPIALTTMQFGMLLFFVEHSGQLLDKETLIAALWPGRVVEDNNLNQHITSLRHVLGEGRHERRFIMNVRGRGYRFVADVMRLNQSLVPMPGHGHMQKAPTAYIGAWQCFQQALFLIGTDDPSQWVVGKDRLVHATTLDPDFASALALLAVLRLRLFTLNVSGPDNGLLLAEQEATRALALRPELAFTHMAVGCVAAARGHWIRAEESFAAANEQDQDWPIVGAIHIAHVLLSVGHLRRALSVARSAQDKPHGMIGILLIYALTYFFNNCDDDARQLLALITAMGGRPDQPHLVDLFVIDAARSGRSVEVTRLLQTTLSPEVRSAGGEAVVAIVIEAVASGSGAADAVMILDQLLAKLAPTLSTHSFRVNVLSWYVQLGAIDRAYDFGNAVLDDYFHQGTTGIYWAVLWEPAMQAFRKDRRFDAFAARIGLADYWHRYGPPPG